MAGFFGLLETQMQPLSVDPQGEEPVTLEGAPPANSAYGFGLEHIQESALQRTQGLKL